MELHRPCLLPLEKSCKVERLDNEFSKPAIKVESLELTSKKQIRPTSYFVEATKRSRKRRREEKQFYLTRNDTLLKEHGFLRQRIKALEDEVETLTLLRDHGTNSLNSRWKHEILNQSLKSQLADYRKLCARYKGMFQMANKIVTKTEMLHSAKANVYFLLERLSFLMKHTQGFAPKTLQDVNLPRKRFLYDEMTKMCVREYALQTGKIHAKLPDNIVVEDWFPELNFITLESNVKIIQHDQYEKWVRCDVKDMPVSMKILQMMHKRIDIFSLMMRGNEAAKRHIAENGQYTQKCGDAFGYSEAYVPLDVLDEQDILGNFSSHVGLEYKRPASSYFNDVAFLSVSDFSPESKNSFLVQSMIPECTSEIGEIDAKGGLFMRGINVTQGSTPEKSNVTILLGLKQTILSEEEDEIAMSFGKSLIDMGAQAFMRSEQHAPMKVLNVLESMFKCSLYVCNFFENWAL